MHPIGRYTIAPYMQQFCDWLQMDPARALRRAGLPQDFLQIGTMPVNGPQFFELWEALGDEADLPDLPLQIVEQMTQAAFDSALYAFSCSPTVRIGMQRKALLKPLLVPLIMQLEEGPETLTMTFRSAVPGRSLPALVGWVELVYFIYVMRQATGEHIVPARIITPQDWPSWQDRTVFLGRAPRPGAEFAFSLSRADADRPLISRNDALWQQIEQGLQGRFAQAAPPQSTTLRVRQALIEGLPGGQATAEQIGRRLGLSKRSLQRKLGEEGQNFKSILEDTRRALALNYLQNSQMSVQEIAYLLGFRDPTSFFRAFRGWTGRTPGDIRAAG